MSPRDLARYQLLFGAYAPSTIKRYLPIVISFLKWCQVNDIPLSSVGAVDGAIAEYFIELFVGGVGKTTASCVIYGLDMFIPGIRLHLPIARRSLRGYNRLCPSEQWPPITLPITAAIAGWLSCKGQFDIAVGVLLSFHCYLRAGELLALHYDDLAIGDDARLGTAGDSQVMYLRLAKTKTGANKGVTIHDHHIKVLVQALLVGRSRGTKVFPFSRTKYLNWFSRAVAALSLPAHYVPHSLRYGGATLDYMSGVPIGDVMVRGRWAVAKSATHYIQAGQALLLANEVPESVNTLGKLILRSLSVSIAFLYTVSNPI